MAETLVAPEIHLPRLPGEDDLPYSDGMKMESQFHVLQMILLIHTLTQYWQDRRDFFVGGDMFVYFSQDQILTKDFRGPDVFVVLDVPRRLRKSWVVWQEGKGPDVVIELLSETTAVLDRTVKMRTYQDELRVPEYFLFDPATGGLTGFVLREGVYEPLPADEAGRLPSRRLGLILVKWTGVYEGAEAEWLRWATPDGVLLPTSTELAVEARHHAEQERQNAEAAQQQAGQERQKADQAQRQAEQAQQKAEQERQRAERLAERLRALGVEPD